MRILICELTQEPKAILYFFAHLVALVDDAEAVERIGAIYNPKYDLDLDWTGAFRLRPRIAFTWLESDFPATATRWVFER